MTELKSELEVKKWKGKKYIKTKSDFLLTIFFNWQFVIFKKKNQQNFRLVYHSLMNDSLFYWFLDDSEASLYQTQWEEYYNQLAENGGKGPRNLFEVRWLFCLNLELSLLVLWKFAKFNEK